MLVPDYLDRPQIVTILDDYRLHIAEFDRWAQPVTESVIRVLTDDLTRLLGTERVSRYPWPTATEVDVAVEIDILELVGTLGETVVIEARWRITADGEILVVRRTTIEEPCEGPDYAALVAAQSRALGTFSREIAGEVTTLLKGAAK